MSIATLTTKGQITIPKHIRDALRLKAGDRIDFKLEGDATVRLRPMTLSPDDVFGMLAPYAKGKKVTVRQMDRAIARAVIERHGRKR